VKLKFRVWNGEQYVSPDYITREGFACWKEDSIPQMSDKIEQFIKGEWVVVAGNKQRKKERRGR
jgi:hypothetical protein